jgi:2-polyprenyl-6-hydroxyphenyl methylase/3-demethylubiquinone-9 3-methyltransferase
MRHRDRGALSVMGGYYAERLAGSRLQQAYTLAPARIRAYLEAEVRFVIDRLQRANRVLELGCGYGRAIREIAPHVVRIAGNDISRTSLELGRSYLRPLRNWTVFQMDASRMAFRTGTFDGVFCIQNGISVFGVDKGRLVAEAARVTRGGGQILFSSYSPRIWSDRLAWFRAQASHGLVGEIDEGKTMDGTIVCKDGFRATTVGSGEFLKLFEALGLETEVQEVDDSSVFATGLVVRSSASALPDRPRRGSIR